MCRINFNVVIPIIRDVVVKKLHVITCRSCGSNDIAVRVFKANIQVIYVGVTSDIASMPLFKYYHYLRYLTPIVITD